MPVTCQNCGEEVTKDYARVFTPDGVTEPRVCPWCPDKKRDGGGVRTAKAPRRTATKHGTTLAKTPDDYDGDTDTDP